MLATEQMGFISVDEVLRVTVVCTCMFEDVKFDFKSES